MNPGQPTPIPVWSRAALRYHLTFLPAICFCFAAGWFELTRARGGRTIAWVYVVEWPLFGIMFAWMWWHVLTDGGTRRPSPPQADHDRDIPEDDPGLRAWQAYLGELEHDANTDRAPGSG
jgi:hypothetical protein